MQKIKGIFIPLVLCSCILTASVNAQVFSSSPQVEPEQPWRIAYYQGGEYNDYYAYLVATITGLVEQEWIEPLVLPELKNQNSQYLWHWLSENVDSRYLEFVADGYYSGDWDSMIRKKNRHKLISRLNQSKDIDMVFAMGTWAGQDLANNLHRVPTVVMSATDPLTSGIIQSSDDSGFDHLFASHDSRLYKQQIQLFHKLIGFKKLGIPYENTLNGRSYASMDMLEQASQQLGFEIVPCYTQSDIVDQQRAEQSVIECFDKLVQKVDAIFVSAQGGVNTETTPKLAEIAYRYGVPTFSQNGQQAVRYGFLLSIIRSGGFKLEGVFLADNIGKIINGAKPRDLKQVFDGSFRVVLNMKTAEKIGLYLDAGLLAVIDTLYWQIELPE